MLGQMLRNFFKVNNAPQAKSSCFIGTEQHFLETVESIFAKNAPVYIFDGTSQGHALLQNDTFHNILQNFLKNGGHAGIIMPGSFIGQQEKIKSAIRQKNITAQITLSLAGRNDFEYINDAVKKDLGQYYNYPIKDIFAIVTKGAYLIERDVYGCVIKANLNDAENGKSEVLLQTMHKFIHTQQKSPLIFPPPNAG